MILWLGARARGSGTETVPAGGRARLARGTAQIVGLASIKAVEVGVEGLHDGQAGRYDAEVDFESVAEVLVGLYWYVGGLA